MEVFGLDQAASVPALIDPKRKGLSVKSPKLKRVRLQASFPDRMGRLMPGLFEVLIDENRLSKIAEKAYHNSGHRSTWGGITVIFRNCSPGQAEYMVEHQEPAPAVFPG